jgi:hypothetical protein
VWESNARKVKNIKKWKGKEMEETWYEIFSVIEWGKARSEE